METEKKIWKLIDRVLGRPFNRIILSSIMLSLSGFLIDLDHIFGPRPMHYLVRESFAAALLYCLCWGLIVSAFVNGWIGDGIDDYGNGDGDDR